MKVAKLLELLNAADPNAELVAEGFDHTLRPMTAVLATALYANHHGLIYPDYGEDVTAEVSYGKRRQVVIVFAERAE